MYLIQHWVEEIPVLVSTDPEQSVRLTLYGGELSLSNFKPINSHIKQSGTACEDGTTLYKALDPPPESYAADKNNEVGIYFIQLKPGARFVLPSAKGVFGCHWCVFVL